MKVGDYVRTKHYGISKITDIYNEDKIELDKENAFGIKGVCYMTENIVKSSPNIIDLIEVEDVISFYEDVDNYKKIYAIKISDLISLDEIIDKISNDNIRLVSIVTKECFESMEYKI